MEAHRGYSDIADIRCKVRRIVYERIVVPDYDAHSVAVNVPGIIMRFRVQHKESRKQASKKEEKDGILRQASQELLV